MPFVKLDTGILDSSLWIEPYGRIMFITALCMALPYELKEPADELETEGMEKTGFVVPPGFYGMVRASSLGIIGRTWPHDKPDVPMDRLFEELKELSLPDPFSRSDEFEGRRMVRINGGFIILNFGKYREMDRTAAERAKRCRDRKAASRRDKRDVTGEQRDGVTHAEAEASIGDVSPKTPLASKRFTKPTLAEVTEAMAGSPNHEREAQQFLDYYDSNGWRVGGKTPMKDWRAAVRTWKRRREDEAAKPNLSFKEAAKAREAELHKTPNPQYGW